MANKRPDQVAQEFLDKVNTHGWGAGTLTEAISVITLLLVDRRSLFARGYERGKSDERDAKHIDAALAMDEPLGE